MAKRKAWSKVIEEHGARVRLYERPNGQIYRAVVTGRTVSAAGKERPVEDRKSLGHSDRDLAEKQARELCKALATVRLTGVSPDTLTLAQLHAAYVRERGSLLSAERRLEVDKAFGLFRRHVGADFKVADVGKHQAETYEAARRAGTLTSPTGRHKKKGVKAGTINKELGCLHAAFNWAETFKQNGRPLINRNPLRGVPLPSEANPARPVASRDRFDKLVGVADEVDRQGVFRTMLVVAWVTGRRLGSIVALRASDVLLTREQVVGALAEAGREEYLAAEWPAAVRWAAEADKEGVEWIVPIPASLVATLTAYIRTRALVGNAVLFPARRDASKPVSKETCYYWIRQAEAKAELPHQTRGGWHALRRSWATARKHMPLQDVMAAGGWRDPASLQKAYQHADAATVRAVMELSEVAASG
jgi:integrase